MIEARALLHVELAATNLSDNRQLAHQHVALTLFEEWRSIKNTKRDVKMKPNRDQNSPTSLKTYKT
jgi:hypothetical protein